MKPKTGSPTTQDREVSELRAKLAAIQAELDDARETITAIQTGAVDALVINTPEGERIFTLQGAEHVYRALVEQMGEGALMLMKDGTIQYSNHSFALFLQRPLEQIIGADLHGFVAESDRARLNALLVQGLTADARAEIEFVAADGTLVPAQVVLSPLAEPGIQASVSMVITNLADRKRAEKLLASSQFTRRLIDTAPIGVAVVDRDMRYILSNPAYGAICADATASTVGRTIAEVFAPEVARVVESAVRQVFDSGQPLHLREYETPIRGRTWWNVINTPLRDRSGGVEAVLIVTEEVTERKLSEQALSVAKRTAEEARAEAEAASRAKDHFLAVLSHELRTPLTPILATIAMLEKGAHFDDATREDLEMIRRNVELEARLIDDLLDVTRIERGKVDLDRHPVEVSTIVRRAVEVCIPDINARNLQLSVELENGPYVISADPARMQQVFWNLLKNAIKFTPKGGSIEIHCRSSNDGYAIIDVRDSGVGIDPADLPRIFKPFEQGTLHNARQFGGLGLGLAISRAMIEMHEGTISAHSEGKNRGATFSIRLPLLTTQADAMPHHQTRPDGAVPRPLRILLVEDHSDTARMMSRFLASEGHQAPVAADVASALNMAKSQPFDLILSDLGLPDGSGLDLLRTLRAQGVNLPAIALSGYGQEQDVEESRKAGFVAHLVKPVSLAKLGEAIAKAAS